MGGAVQFLLHFAGGAVIVRPQFSARLRASISHKRSSPSLALWLSASLKHSLSAGSILSSGGVAIAQLNMGARANAALVSPSSRTAAVTVGRVLHRLSVCPSVLPASVPMERDGRDRRWRHCGLQSVLGPLVVTSLVSH
jgi:hypothetical protein